jgi:hypothetical protein
VAERLIVEGVHVVKARRHRMEGKRSAREHGAATRPVKKAKKPGMSRAAVARALKGCSAKDKVAALEALREDPPSAALLKPVLSLLDDLSAPVRAAAREVMCATPLTLLAPHAELVARRLDSNDPEDRTSALRVLRLMAAEDLAFAAGAIVAAADREGDTDDDDTPTVELLSRLPDAVVGPALVGCLTARGHGAWKAQRGLLKALDQLPLEAVLPALPAVAAMLSPGNLYRGDALAALTRLPADAVRS